MNSNYYINEDTIKEFKLLVVRNKKSTIERHLIELISNQSDKNLAYVLIFYFLLTNWSTIKEIKLTAQTIKKHKAFGSVSKTDAFNDRRKIISRGANFLLQ